MADEIDKKILEYLEGLARVEIDETKMSSEKLLKDLKNILNYFEELKAFDTANVEPVSHEFQLSTILREDTVTGEQVAKHESLLGAFSKREGDFLKIPPVFKNPKS